MKTQITIVVALLASSTLADAHALTGGASYYGGRGRTASGVHVGGMTAAHKTLPFGTLLRVTNLRNHRSAVVTVNDRGPFVRGRIVDVSVGAANALGMRSAGIASVRIEVVSRRSGDVRDAPETTPTRAQPGADWNPFAELFGSTRPVM